MATHYIETEQGGNQYYFDGKSNATSQAQRSTQDSSYAVPVAVTTTVGSNENISHPVGVSGLRSQHQQIRSDHNVHVEGDSYQLPQQHQSVAGFNKSVSQQQYQTAPPSAHQVKATVRTVNTQEQQHHGSSVQHQQQQQQAYGNYGQQTSPQSSQVSSQHQQYPYESRQQVGQPTSVSGYYQAPSSAQHTHQEVDHRTESPSRGRDQHAQAQPVPVRTITSNPHQQYENGISYPQQSQQSQQHSTSQSSKQSQQQQEDQLQQYYSQLTPEQYQQLLRQQQIQRQQQEEQKRQQLAQQQYFIEQERQRTEQQQQQQYQSSRSNQEQQHRQQGQDQHDVYHYRPQQVQTTVSSNVSQESYRQQQQQQQQQHHGQQGQSDAYYEQQRRATAQQSPSSSTYQQEQYRSTVGVSGGQQQYQQVSPSQQQHVRTDSERQRQDEQEYYAAQLARQQQQEREHVAQLEAAQRAQQQEREYAAQIEASQRQQVTSRIQQQQYQEQQQHQQQIIQGQQTAQPVGIRGLMSKFTGPTTIPTYEPKPKSSTTQHYSTSSYTSSSGPGQKTTTTTTHSSKTHSMTYSALPKANEPPVNSAEYYQMLQQGNLSNTSSNVQHSAAPLHIQGPPPGFDALRNRFKSGSVSESINPIQDIRQQHQSNTGNSSLLSLRDQYMNRAKESAQTQEESFSQRIQTVSRSTVMTGQSSQNQKQTSSVLQVSQQDEPQLQSQSISDQGVSSEGAVAEGGSSSGASPFENDANLTTTMTTSAH
ncbi:unnamed protein product [Rotaria sp. Silwood1]|nr:unnamed protein product [Rotaria sp. Silwood1]CAF4689353.1 unnamed protein product [Rotaria sp. Silwood1]